MKRRFCVLTVLLSLCAATFAQGQMDSTVINLKNVVVTEVRPEQYQNVLVVDNQRIAY